MYNWNNLNEDYGEVWDKFDAQFKFSPSYYERKIPAISEPSPFVTFDLLEDLPEASIDEITTIFSNAFRKLTPSGGIIYFLDWQHNSYRFDPHESEDAGFRLWYPDGDYFIFLTQDFSCGTFGHPWQLTLCVFGTPLLNIIGEPLRKLLPVLRESKR